MPTQPRTRQLAYRTRLVLAVLFGLIVAGVVGMHLLSVDHRLATPEPSGHGEYGSHALHQPDPAMPAQPVGEGHGCGDCGDHVMLFGSCLLVMVFGLLWGIVRPTRGGSWPAPPPGWRRAAAFLDPLPRDFRTALTHVELAISRT
ncbi:hypothetical protein [Microlunatus parietis]|uniref:Uncharacterized protein n=1 Tax=Microlunatus parietis TaxID=682979 RepID=A0A7Y9I4G1_9ACTN|nr:hypothetical protein [Microlunatus parietis]NYE70059.1 hypothetical protein [Microlunatus parietis]